MTHGIFLETKYESPEKVDYPTCVFQNVEKETGDLKQQQTIT